MPSNTTYYSLWIFDPSTDTGATFLTFRSDIAGTASNSNMMLIDAALHTHDIQIAALQTVKGIIYVPALYQSANFFTATGIAGISAYVDGMIIDLTLDTTCTGTVTLAINGLATKTLYKYNSSGSLVNLAAGDLYAKREHLFRYSSTAGAWIWIDPTSGDQVNIPGTAGNLVTVGSDNTLLGTTTQAGHLADTTHAATAKTTPVDADEFSLIDSAASFVLKKLTLAALKLAIYVGIKPPEGTMWNGRISATVASNNLTLALKTFAGTGPSATDPVYITINGVVRTITAALSVTRNAGTNWCNAGCSELAAREVDYFAYLGYNATDGITIGFSRISYATIGSDFGAINSTTERTILVNPFANFGANDPYVIIGRFAAILSAGAGYTWSVPTFTPANLIQRPIYETRLLTYLPSVTAETGAITSYTCGTNAYRIVNNILYVYGSILITNKGTGANGLVVSIPFPMVALSIAGMGGGRENVTTGALLTLHARGGSNPYIYKIDGTTVINTNYQADWFGVFGI